MIDYEEWVEGEAKKYIEICSQLVSRIVKKEKPSILSLVPEFRIDKGESYTLCTPGFQIGGRLENLVPYYNKIIIPIYNTNNKEDFKYYYGVYPEDLIKVLEADEDKYFPIITSSPNFYRHDLFDDLFETCKKLYGEYPPFPSFRIMSFQEGLVLRIIAEIKGIEDPKKVLEEHPLLDSNKSLRFVEQLVKKAERGHEMLHKLKLAEEYFGNLMATVFRGLYVFGYDKIIDYILNIYETSHYLTYLLLLEIYYMYLMRPVLDALGGFVNYTLKDLYVMDFLRIPLLPDEKIEGIKRELYSGKQKGIEDIFAISPASISAISVEIEEIRARVFLNGDLKLLDTLCDIAERHKKESRVMYEYRKAVAEGDIEEILRSAGKMDEVFNAIEEDVRNLEIQEKAVEYIIKPGLTALPEFASDIIPPELKPVTAVLLDLLRRFMEKYVVKIDSAEIVKKAHDFWDVVRRSLLRKKATWYEEKGVAYLLWINRAHWKKISKYVRI